MPNRYLLRELVTLVCIHCGPIPCRPRARINVTRYPWRKKTTEVLLYYRDAPGFRPDSPSFLIRYPAGYRKYEQLNTYRYLVSKRPDIRQIIQLGSIETKKIREMEKILPNMHSMVQREQTKVEVGRARVFNNNIKKVNDFSFQLNCSSQPYQHTQRS